MKKILSQRIETLIDQMTLTEKISLLSGRNSWYTRAIERLGIPAIVMTDGPHGVRTGGLGQDRIVGTATAYPTGVSMAASWNRDLIRRVGVALAEETRHMGCHILLGPCVNIVRSPLGGRNFETYSEDPYLAGQIGTAYVRGLQSQKIGASVKHFAANNQEIERKRGNSVVDERTLREIYLPAFETIVKEADPWTVMCCYNRVNGVYGSENAILLRKILKEEWGFKGLVVSDWGAVHDIFKPVAAGLDLEMPGPARYFGQLLEAAVINWQIEERFVDEAVRRILSVVERAGVMSEDPLPEGSGDTSEHRALARELAAESMVLLKNDAQTLPFSPSKIKKLAVIGLNASRMITGGGSSRVDAHRWVTALEGLQAKLGDEVTIGYEPGYDNRVLPDIVPPSQFLHTDGETQGLQVDYFNNLDLSGEPVLSRVEENMGTWWAGSSPETGVVDSQCFSARWMGSFVAPESGGTEFVLLNTGVGKLWLDDELILENQVGMVTSTSVEVTELVGKVSIDLEKGRRYAFKAEFSSGENSQYALMRLLYIPPLGVEGDLGDRAVRLAEESDAVLVVAGLQDSFESEGFDREDLSLPGDQETLIRAVAAANPNTAVAVNAGAPVAMPWADAVNAILLTYYPGQEGGHALADIVFGDVNPSGKLTVTFPKRLEDHPAFVNYPGKRDVRYGEGVFVGYRYYDAKDVAPLFPFGHGLSYTTYDYQNMNVPEKVWVGESFQISVTVVNTGDVTGKEIVQVYLSDAESELVRPPKELKAFEKVALTPGESKTLRFDLDPRALSYYDPDRAGWVAEPGVFTVKVGASVQDIRLQADFELLAA